MKPNQNNAAEPVVAGGGIVSRHNEGAEEEILMIFRNGKWDLPKGKHEPPESISMCAAREVAEETGSSLPAIVQKVGTTYHEYEEKGETMGKTTHWYSMIFTKPGDLSPQREEGITNIKWVPLAEAIQKVEYDNLKELLLTYKEISSYKYIG